MPELIDAYAIPGRERETALDPGELLRQMDTAGISRAVIAPEDRELAVWNESGNRRLLEVAGASEGRLIPSCTASPWRGEQGVSLVRDAVDAGARMLVLDPLCQGFVLTDEVADPLLRFAGDRRLPVYVHTGAHSVGAPTQAVLLAARFPQTPFILAHCGSTDYAHDMRAVFQAAPANVWFELSLVRPWGMAAYGALLSTDRFIFATSTPRNDPVFEVREFGRHWPLDEHPATYAGNILALIGGVDG